MMVGKSDEALVVEIQDGSISAFEILVRRYQKRLLSYVHHRINTMHEAEDVVQESLFNIYKTIERIDITKKFSSYIYTITRNTAVSYLRMRKRDVSLDAIQDLEYDAALYENLEAADRKNQVNLAIGRLDKKYQRMIRLYYFDDLSYEEISKALHIPINTVRTHLVRAKAILRKNIPYEIH